MNNFLECGLEGFTSNCDVDGMASFGRFIQFSFLYPNGCQMNNMGTAKERRLKI
jgi:hypothetical protein